MNPRKFSVLIILLFTFYFLFFSSVFAQGDDFLGVKDFTVQRIAAIITGFACWLIGIVLAIMVIFLVVAGIRYFLARGNETKVADATKNLRWTLVGILVILATNVIIATVANALQPGLNYSLLPLNCGPFAETGGRFLTCRGGPNDCPEGLVCEIGPGQDEGLCLRP